MDRRQFLKSATLLGGAMLLPACGSGSGGGSGSSPSTTHPSIGSEPGNLAILEWGGYEAAGTKAQKYWKIPGKAYTDKFGASGITYTYIVNDSQALQKASQVQFDIMHPCNENTPDYVSRGLVQPWDTSLLPSFHQLNPFLVDKGKVNGLQYMIPWDWGYASLTYNSDHVDPADATGWELAWNPKYKGKISLWDGAASNLEVAALKLGFPKMDMMTTDQLSQAKQALIEQKPLNKLYWDSEYGQMQPNLKNETTWIAYSWQDAAPLLNGSSHKFVFLDPSQGRLSWFCGFMLGKNTKNYRHAHAYVESFINQPACADMTNIYYYGTSNIEVKTSDIKDQALAKALDLGNPHAIAASNVHLQSWEPNRAAYDLAWEEVKAA
ncbi:MAG: ABC transporter substrate-binding protein [Gaiellales bacterium]